MSLGQDYMKRYGRFFVRPPALCCADTLTRFPTEFHHWARDEMRLGCCSQKGASCIGTGMNRSIRQWAGVVALGAMIAGCANMPSERGDNVTGAPTRTDIRAISTDVYVFAYPLVLMDVTREIIGSKPPVTPANTFEHQRLLPDVRSADTAFPSLDTLTSTAWLDLSDGPVIFTVPATHGRFYVMPVLDAWSNVIATASKRTTGTRRTTYVITPPGWRGALPPNVTEIRSPTNSGWVVGKIQVNGRADVPAVIRLQDQFRLVPLNGRAPQRRTRAAEALPRQPAPPMALALASGGPVPVDTETAPVEQVSSMDAQLFFSRFSSLLLENPPSAEDAAMLTRIRALGIEPGLPLSTTALEPEAARAMQEGATQGMARIATQAGTLPAEPGAWQVVRGATAVTGSQSLRDMGDYTRRAAIAFTGMTPVDAQDLVQSRTGVDALGKALNGRHRYVLHFDKGDLPPAKAFWTLGLYDDKQGLAANSANRYSVGSHDRLRRNRDGSVDILVQRDRPRQPANWLPAPAGPFELMLRLYWPDASMLQGGWTPPPVQRLD